MKPKYTHTIRKLPEDIQIILKNNVVFYSTNYEQYINKSGRIPIYIYTEDYILLFVLTKKHLFRYIDLPVEYIAINNEASSPQIFLDECIGILSKSFHIQWINQTSISAVFNTYPSQSLRIPFGTKLINLTNPEGSLFSGLERTCRQQINKCEKSGVQIRQGGKELLDDFLKLESETLGRSSLITNYRKEHLEVIDSLGEMATIFIAYKDSIPQSGLFLLYNKAMCYAMWGGSANFQVGGSSNLLFWKVIQYMHTIGVKYFNFVGYRIHVDKDSKHHGIQRFKDTFGGELKVGYLFKVILNQPMYNAWRLLSKVKSKRVSRDIIECEIHKWKELN